MNKNNFLSMLILLMGIYTSSTFAKSASQLDNNVNEVVNTFIKNNQGADAFLVKAKAFLVFPDIKEAGMFIGGKYGEGVLRVQRTTKAYYSIQSASIGMQMGAQQYSMIIAFTSDTALNKFLVNDNWNTDINGKITVAKWNTKEALDNIHFDTDVVAFIFNATGIMGNLTLEGTKFKRINPS